ncbi:hypothetical protein ACI76O_07695 [Capnocytophaga cynodegmi]
MKKAHVLELRAFSRLKKTHVLGLRGFPDWRKHTFWSFGHLGE